MKNILYIDIDTDREQMVMVGKPPSIPEPTNRDEAKAMVMHDIECLTEVICSIINMSTLNGYETKEKLVLSVIDRLTNFLKKQDGHSKKNLDNY